MYLKSLIMFLYDYFFSDWLQQAELCLQVREEAICLAIPAGGTDSSHVRRTEEDRHQRRSTRAHQLHRKDLDQRNH